MRIALFHHLPSGGAKRAVYEWTRGLAAAHSVHVYTLSTADHPFCDVRPYTPVHRVFDFHPQPLFRSPLGRLNRLQYWRDLRALTQLGRRIGAEIDRGGYDVVFAHPCRYTSIPVFLSILRTPPVYYLHEPFGGDFPPLIARPYARCPRRLLDRLDPLLRLQRGAIERARRRSLARTRLLANSEFTRERMRATYGAAAMVVRCGVDVEAFHPHADPATDNAVVSVGELAPHKGFDFLVESLATLPVPQRPTLTLVCNAGSNDETRYVQELAARRGVDLRLRWRLSTAELAAEYRRARLCVYAPVAEAFGLVPLEAMACGIPIVAVAEGGVPESVVDGVTGRLVPRDAQMFGEAVRALMTDVDEHKRLAANARDYVCRDWTWDGSVRRLEAALRWTVSDGDALSGTRDAGR